MALYSIMFATGMAIGPLLGGLIAEWFALEIAFYFPSALALASAILFGVIGFLGGLISRAWLLASVVPIPALLFSKSMIDFPRVQDLGVLEKAIVIVFAQIAVCCLFAYLGSRLRPRAKLAKQ